MPILEPPQHVTKDYGFRAATKDSAIFHLGQLLIVQCLPTIEAIFCHGGVFRTDDCALWCCISDMRGYVFLIKMDC